MKIANTEIRNVAKKICGFRNGNLLMVFLCMYVFVSILAPCFFSLYNIGVMLKAITYLGFIALAQNIVLILGDIDLSVGAIAALSGVITGFSMSHYSMPVFLAVFFGLFVGVLCGLLNGLIVTKLKVSALIATLGTQGIFTGLNLVLTKGSAVMGLPKKFFFWGQKNYFGFIPLAFLIMIVSLTVMTLFLKKMVLGRHIFAVGSNNEAARIVGLKVNKIKIIAFSISGFLSSLAGILMVSRLTSAQPSIGDGWIMPSVAACVIGGTPLSGGEGSAVGILLGVCILSLIDNSIVLLKISPYWQTFVSGLVVVIAVALDTLRKKKGAV